MGNSGGGGSGSGGGNSGSVGVSGMGNGGNSVGGSGGSGNGLDMRSIEHCLSDIMRGVDAASMDPMKGKSHGTSPTRPVQ